MGGMVVYYSQSCVYAVFLADARPSAQTTSQTTAFPQVSSYPPDPQCHAYSVLQGFRMTAGDPMLRSYNASIPASPHIIFRCLESDEESGQETSGMPTTACVGGIRSQLQFPT
jgi:hypothetical protein